MAFGNDKPNNLSIDALAPSAEDQVLELGFGPGWALRTIAAAYPTAGCSELTNPIECFGKQPT